MSSLETPVDLTKDDDSVHPTKDDDDVVFIQTDSFKFYWEAKPATLERARKSWKSNRLYIPAATRKAKKEMIAGIVEELNNASEPIYGKGIPVVVEARFYMPRPNYDFKAKVSHILKARDQYRNKEYTLKPKAIQTDRMGCAI